MQRGKTLQSIWTSESRLRNSFKNFPRSTKKAVRRAQAALGNKKHFLFSSLTIELTRQPDCKLTSRTYSLSKRFQSWGLHNHDKRQHKTLLTNTRNEKVCWRWMWFSLSSNRLTIVENKDDAIFQRRIKSSLSQSESHQHSMDVEGHTMSAHTQYVCFCEFVLKRGIKLSFHTCQRIDWN